MYKYIFRPRNDPPTGTVLTLFLQVLVTWLKIRSQKVISNQQFSRSLLVSGRVDVFLPFGGTFTFQPLVFGGVFPSNGYG